MNTWEFTVEINAPRFLETDCRFIKLVTTSLAQVFEIVNPQLCDDEYIRAITLKIPESSITWLVWDYILGPILKAE